MTSKIGVDITRIDALDKVTGKALFPADLMSSDMLHMKILFAGRPHARVRSIDVSKAESYPGVVAIFTASDVPVNEYGLINADQPVLVGPDSNKEGADIARFVGDQLALVVAETEEAAIKARELILVNWTDLPVVTDPYKAMKSDSPVLFESRDSNIIKHNRIRAGDITSAWKSCEVIVESVYRTPWQEHAYLQPEAGISYIDSDGRITVEVAGQWVHEEQKQIAHALGIPIDQVRVIHPAIGGAFGGREDVSVQIVLALAVWHLHQRGIKRPVKIVWSREESIVGHHKRHPYNIYAKWGASSDGRILAAEVEMVADAGAYEYTSAKVLGNATLQSTGPYDIPNVSVDAYAVYTNNVPSGAFRGFGGPQGAFAAESQVNKLAQKLGLDVIEMRRRNLIGEGSVGQFNAVYPEGVTIRQVVEECAARSNWPITQSDNSLPTNIRRGYGFACALKNVGFSFGFPEECWAKVELHGGSEIERVVLHHAGAECGQGAHTVFVQMAAEACGVPIECIQLEAADSALTKNSGSASASRMTFMAGNSIRGAVDLALENWKSEERPAIGEYKFVPRQTTALDAETGECDPNITYGYVAQRVVVEVDIETGHIRVVDVMSVDDVGRAINPIQVAGQIEGAVVQAHGYTLLENLISRDGYIETAHFSNYLIPTSLDVPERVEAVILEYADPQGPWGLRGVAEMPFLPYAPAIIAAVNDATGIWFDEFPLIPERVLRGLDHSEYG
ncbi:MAG: xanthine dehydrogenase family protein molybdopterin-binding subunit [Anaerolineales bacterium]